MVTSVQPYNDGSKQREVQLIFRTASSVTTYEATYTDKGGKKHGFTVKPDGVETRD